jgi:hypothetical protein
MRQTKCHFNVEQSLIIDSTEKKHEYGGQFLNYLFINMALFLYCVKICLTQQTTLTLQIHLMNYLVCCCRGYFTKKYCNASSLKLIYAINTKNN